MLVTQQPTTENSQEYKQQCNPTQFITKTKTELKYLFKIFRTNASVKILKLQWNLR